MTEMSLFREQDRKNPWRFRPYEGGNAMDFDSMIMNCLSRDVLDWDLEQEHLW